MTIKVYNNIQDLTGIGEEWLEIEGLVIAKFIDGNLDTDIVVGNIEITKVTA